VYARKFDSKTKTMSTITVQEFQNDVLVRVENADQAIWDKNQWIMQQGVIYDLSVGGGVDRMMHFSDQILPINQSPNDIAKSTRDPEEMTIKELREQIKAYEASYVNTNKLKMEMYNRFALPMASLVCALIGAPLGLQKQRGSSSMGFGISVIVIFAYYSVMTLSDSMGKSGVIPPLLAAWIPNSIGFCTGAYLIWRASK
jgi:lipopolysaccharide export system permease protein